MTSVVIGRAEIAHRLGRSERTVTRWIRLGILPATHTGPAQNNLLLVRAEDLERVRAMFSGHEQVA
ncbi:helix-turn-helix domain-containing protein [Phenylobacterium sp.]|uniref:helix-turn-helix domain-containing protein n=1 Tax=Phenylobacterium sp. TaxID=1871053 RepID=UPI0035AD7FE3